jgi:hypothetical protein
VVEPRNVVRRDLAIVATPSAINAGVVAIHEKSARASRDPFARDPTTRKGTKILNPQAADRPIPNRTDSSVLMGATLARCRRWASRTQHRCGEEFVESHDRQTTHPIVVVALRRTSA